MRHLIFVTVVFASRYSLQAQVPKAPFTAQDAEAGKKLAATSVEIRAQIKEPQAGAEPFKMLGNLYFVGSQNGESYLLTSPQGHILMGAGSKRRSIRRRRTSKQWASRWPTSR